jgi:hypothetical protein
MRDWIILIHIYTLELPGTYLECNSDFTIFWLSKIANVLWNTESQCGFCIMFHYVQLFPVDWLIIFTFKQIIHKRTTHVMSNMTHAGLNNTNPYLYLRVTRYIFGMQQWLHNIEKTSFNHEDKSDRPAVFSTSSYGTVIQFLRYISID